MRIKVVFTLDVNPKDVAALKELAGGVETAQDAAEFVRQDAGDYASGYLFDNGIRNRLLWPWDKR